MEALDTFLRIEMEALQYAAFFGALIVCSTLELLIERSKKAPRRGRRWPLNYGLTFLNILALGAMPVSGVFAADYARAQGIGVLNVLMVGPVAALVIGILFRSFVSWGIHLAMHKIPLLWRVHRVHHTDTFLDASTTVRFHPIEFLITTPMLVLAVVVVGVSPVALMVYEIFDAAMAAFTHANIRLSHPVERLARLILVTPDMHRVHHSSWQPETDSNFGATLSIWDRLFGTYREKDPESLKAMQLGLTECQDQRSSSFWWVLSLPLRASTIRSDDNPGLGRAQSSGEMVEPR